MTKEQEYLINILQDHIAGRTTEPLENADWLAISNLARIHQVDGIVYAQCKNFIPSDALQKFAQAYSAVIYYYVNRQKDMIQITDAMRKNNIPCFSVKGLEVAQYYPVPALRTMGDCDIIVRPDDFYAAADVMNRLGFFGTANIDRSEWKGERNGILYEVHGTLVKNDMHIKDYQTKFFNDFMPYVCDGVLDWNFHFLFLFAHLYKHIVKTGAGLRHFMDLAVLISHGPKLDWQWIEEKLNALELHKFAHACYSLIEEWFGVSAPVQYKKMDKETHKYITQKLLDDGLFGFSNDDNLNNHSRDLLIIKSGPLWTRRFITLLNNTFLGYDEMKNYPKCSFLQSRPYLLPAAWVCRFAQLIARKDKSVSRQTIGNSFISTD